MEITIVLHEVIIKDQASGQEFKIRTLRTAQEIVEELEQSEKEVSLGKLQEAVSEAYLK
jgi:hypothetical protein